MSVSSRITKEKHGELTVDLGDVAFEMISVKMERRKGSRYILEKLP